MKNCRICLNPAKCDCLCNTCCDAKEQRYAEIAEKNEIRKSQRASQNERDMADIAFDNEQI